MIRVTPSDVRPFVAVLSLLAYALPAVVLGLSGVGHGVQHLLEEAREQRRVAATLGLVHSEAKPPIESAPQTDRALPEAGFVHSHGGTVHAHMGSLSGLLVAADETQEDPQAALSLWTELTQHISPGSVIEVALLTPEWSPTAGTPLRPSDATLLPDLPPPRG